MKTSFSPLSMARAAWRLLPLEVRATTGASARALIAPALAKRLPRAVQMHRRPANVVSVLGANSSRLGVGQGARLLVEELRGGGVDVRMLDATALIGAPQDHPSDAISETDGDWPLIVALNPDVAVHVLSGFPRHRLQGRRIIGFWVWELTTLARTWRVGRDWVHEVWTPSHFSARALQSLQKPVIVTPHPAALAPKPALPTRAAARAALNLPADAFIAINSFSLSSSLTRKNPIDAMAAFAQAFPRGDALLVIRALEADRYPAAWRALQSAAARYNPVVRLLPNPGGLEVLHKLYAAADLYVSLHRAEGFGLNLAEAMQHAIPILATAFSAPLEFLDPSCAALAPATLIPAHDPFGPYSVPGAQWAQPDIAAAAALLQRLAQDKAWRNALAENATKRFASMRGGAALRALHMDNEASA